MGQKLSEYHTGYRAFAARVLETLPLDENSDDFVFDNQMLVPGDPLRVPRSARSRCPTRYFPEASSINFRRSVVYGIGVLGCALLNNRFRARLQPEPTPARKRNGVHRHPASSSSVPM